jgi:hypothetical protein
MHWVQHINNYIRCILSFNHNGVCARAKDAEKASAPV